jgi:hypothetical protein
MTSSSPRSHLCSSPETMEVEDHGVKRLKPLTKINLSSLKIVYSRNFFHSYRKETNTVGIPSHLV